MKTHDTARALLLLARSLKSGADADLKTWVGSTQAASLRPKDGSERVDPRAALRFVAGLANFTKVEWRALICEWGLPIDVLDTYSIRDTIGKVFGYVAAHPDVVEKIVKSPDKKRAETSPELDRVLAKLLGEPKGNEAEFAKTAEKAEPKVPRRSKRK